MSVLGLLDLRERLMSRRIERDAYIELLRLALTTRMAVSDCLRRMIQEKDEDAKTQIRSEARSFEAEFEKQKNEFVRLLAEAGIKSPEFTYGDMCNTMLP